MAEADELATLVSRAQLGDIGALDSLLRDVRRAVLRYASAQRVGRDDAEDLAQEVCLAVVKVLPDWRDSGRSMWAFAFTVARNKLTDGIRRQVRQGGLGRLVALDDGSDTGAVAVPDRGLGPEDRALISDGTRQMDRLLRMLPTTQREVLLMRTVVGLTARETAEALGLTPGSVHVLQHRAITKLRGLYAEASDADSPTVIQP